MDSIDNTFTRVVIEDGVIKMYLIRSVDEMD